MYLLTLEEYLEHTLSRDTINIIAEFFRTFTRQLERLIDKKINLHIIYKTIYLFYLLMFKKPFYFCDNVCFSTIIRDYSYRINFSQLQIDSRLVLIAIFFLVCKQQRYFGKINMIITAYLLASCNNVAEPNEQEIKQVIFHIELDALPQLDYQFNIQTPDQFLEHFFQKYPQTISEKIKNDAKILLYKLMLFTNLSIVYQPWVLALASLHSISQKQTLPSFFINQIQHKWWTFNTFIQEQQQPSDKLLEKAKHCQELYKKLKRNVQN